MTKSFATLENKIQELSKEDSNITESDNKEEASHFHFEETGFQMMQLEEDSLIQGVRHEEVSQDIPGVPFEEATVFQQEFEKRNANVILFKQNHGKKIELDLKNVILLDSQSTMDLFCNPKFVDNIKKSSKSMRLKSNGGTMMVSHKATMKGYKSDVWFSKDAITNNIALSNLIKQYRVTYNSKDQMFVVHREKQNKPNVEFKMHESGLHYYVPQDKDFIFVNAVSGNKVSARDKSSVQSSQVLCT
jgi:hypothetical protein